MPASGSGNTWGLRTGSQDGFFWQVGLGGTILRDSVGHTPSVEKQGAALKPLVYRYPLTLGCSGVPPTEWPRPGLSNCVLQGTGVGVFLE